MKVDYTKTWPHVGAPDGREVCPKCGRLGRVMESLIGEKVFVHKGATENGLLEATQRCVLESTQSTQEKADE